MLRQSKALALLVATAFVVMTWSSALAQSKYFKNWPAGSSPQEVGKRVAENFVARKFEFEQMVKSNGEEKPKRQFVIYSEDCSWHGALTDSELTVDTDLC